MLLRTTALVVLSLPWSASTAEAGPDDHYAEYSKLLETYVDAKGLVDYAAFKKNDEAALKECVAAFAAMDVASMKRDEKMAYWINVYNAVTLQAMLEFYPLDSIKDKVSKVPGFYDVWDDYEFGKEKLSLNHIEHKLLRPMKDPRVHAAIVCASLGCPILRNEAYLPSRLPEQLDDNVRRWFKDPTRGLKLSGNVVYISAIFDWFADDFPKTKLLWIAKYVDEDTAKLLRGGSKLTVKYIDWDWALNEQ